jgi:hypothetical protein
MLPGKKSTLLLLPRARWLTLCYQFDIARAPGFLVRCLFHKILYHKITLTLIEKLRIIDEKAYTPW